MVVASASEIIAFIAKDCRAVGQHKGQFMDRRQILLARRQQVKTDGNASRVTHQMQAPAEELFAFGRTIAAIGFTPHFFATPSARPLGTNNESARRRQPAPPRSRAVMSAPS